MFTFITQITVPSELDQYFISIAALAGAVIAVTEFLKRGYEKLTKRSSTSLAKWLKQITTWAVSIGLVFLGSYFELGIFADLSTTYIIIYGVGTGLVANGIFDFVLVQLLVDLFKKKK